MEMKNSRPSIPHHWGLSLSGVLGLLAAFGISALAQAPTAAPAAPEAKGPVASTSATSPQVSPQDPSEKAWGILREGLKDNSADKRAKSVRALGLLAGNVEAEKAALHALQDDKANVRLAAAMALGSMNAAQAALALKKALEDSEPAVVLAAANSLLLLHDDVGYDIYYDVLTGERRASKGMIKEQLSILKDKKKMAELGFEEGIGFIPFAGMGYEAFKTVRKDDSSPVRAAAAKQLAHDPDPGTAKALVKATTDKNWSVRAAALEAIAQRGDRSLLSQIAGALDDAKDVVRFTAAACVAHLSELPEKKSAANPAKP
jgi:HEAT repeat protein